LNKWEEWDQENLLKETELFATFMDEL